MGFYWYFKHFSISLSVGLFPLCGTRASIRHSCNVPVHLHTGWKNQSPIDMGKKTKKPSPQTPHCFASAQDALKDPETPRGAHIISCVGTQPSWSSCPHSWTSGDTCAHPLLPGRKLTLAAICFGSCFNGLLFPPGKEFGVVDL